MFLEIALFFLTYTIGYNLYLYIKLKLHFEKWGLKYVKGVPLFGNSLRSKLGLNHVIEDIDAVYKEFPDEKYVAYMEGMTPVILVRDPELMKLITIKNFDHFVNRREAFPLELDPLLGASVLNMKDNVWRVMRNRLSLSFNGAKMKSMVPCMIEVSRNIVEYLKDHQSEDIDVNEIMRCYTTDVFATTGFGLHVNSVRERNNEFYVLAEQALNITMWRKLYYFFTLQFPLLAKITKFLGFSLFPKNITHFFRKIVSHTKSHRKTNNAIRPNFTNSLLDVAEECTVDEITGQVYFGFLASFESISAVLALCMHELALHPEVQERLYQKIRQTQEKEGDLTYDTIAELKCIDSVINETLRKWSVTVMMDRICTKPYTLPPPREGGKAYVVQPGTLVYNVVNSIQMDPVHHPNPETFDPERFSDGEKHNIKPFTFMPFGMGPRSCPGIRYSTLKMKVMLYYLMLNFKIVKCKKTVEKIKLQSEEFHIGAVGDTYVRFEPRR